MRAVTDAGYYADKLAVPQGVLSRALTEVTGRGTKELITDRRMLEAARLLRFTNLTVGEVAFRAGYHDQLYFSRAFKRHYGEPPMAYRERLRGRMTQDVHTSARPVHSRTRVQGRPWRYDFDRNL